MAFPYSIEKKLLDKFNINNQKLDLILETLTKQTKYKCLFDDYITDNPDEIIKYMSDNYYDKLVNYADAIWKLPPELNLGNETQSDNYTKINEIIRKHNKSKSF